MRRIPLLDAVLAGVGLLATLIEAALWWRWGAWPYLLQTVVSGGLAVTLLLRRRLLVGAAVATFALLAAMAAIAWTSPVGTGTSPLLFCAPLTVVALTRYGRQRWWGLAGALVAVAGLPLSPALALGRGADRPAPFTRWDELGWMLAAHVLVIAAAYLWALRQREVADRHAAELAEVRDRESARAELAAAHERNRIAREVHDVVAHSVALIRVEAATGLAIAQAEPEHATRALATIKRAAGDAMVELRGMVGMLRDPAGGTDLSPAASLASVPRTLDRVRDAGLDLASDVPDPDRLSELDDQLAPLVRLAAVRVLQEALTNAVKHADHTAPVHVRFDEDGDELRISVRNRVGTATATDGGHGLAGLVERVTGAGGSVRAGRSGEEYLLTAELPARRSMPDAGAERR